MSDQKSNLYRDALADANAMRDTAMELAKQQLLEAFAPKIQSIVSSKLAEEMSDDDEEEGFGDPTGMEGEGEAAPAKPEADPTMTADDETDLEGGDEFGEEGGEGDVEASIDELLAQIAGDTESEEEAELQGSEEELEPGMAREGKEIKAEDKTMTEDIDALIESLLSEGDEEDETMDEGTTAEELSETEELEEQLKEANQAIVKLQKEIKEVNLLNSKLLYTNNLFKEHELSESKKIEVVKVFDKASSVKETKLIYESLKTTLSKKKATTKKVVKEGAGSKPTGGTAPEKTVITEGNALRDRFMKLANIKQSLKG